MDAEGFTEHWPCPQCGSEDTVTYYYREGFTELECKACQYRSDWQELNDLESFSGELLKADPDLDIPLPRKPLEA